MGMYVLMTVEDSPCWPVRWWAFAVIAATMIATRRVVGMPPGPRNGE